MPPSTKAHSDQSELQAFVEPVTDKGPTQPLILLFDQNGHPVAPTCALRGRRAQRRSRMAEGHREAAPGVLDGREHDGILPRSRTTLTPTPPLRDTFTRRRLCADLRRR